VVKESGVNRHPWQTPDPIVNQALSDWDAQTQLTELLYRVLIWLSCLGSRAWSAVIKAMNGWVNQRQHANRHRPRRSDEHSLAVVVLCCIKLLCDRTWSDQGWNHSAGNVCVPVGLVWFLLGWYVQTPSLSPKAKLSLCNCCSPIWILSLYTLEWLYLGAIPPVWLPIPRYKWRGYVMFSELQYLHARYILGRRHTNQVPCLMLWPYYEQFN